MKEAATIHTEEGLSVDETPIGQLNFSIYLL